MQASAAMRPYMPILSPASRNDLIHTIIDAYHLGIDEPYPPELSNTRPSTDDKEPEQP